MSNDEIKKRYREIKESDIEKLNNANKKISDVIIDEEDDGEISSRNRRGDRSGRRQSLDLDNSDVEGDNAENNVTIENPDKKFRNMKRLKKSNINDDDEEEIKNLVDKDLGLDQIQNITITTNDIKSPMAHLDNKSNPKRITIRKQELKKQVLGLSQIWNLDLGKAKHWYRRLKREDKLIFKGLMK